MRIRFKTSQWFWTCVVATVCILQAGNTRAQSPELIVELDKRQIYEGESIHYRITVNNVADPPVPDLSHFEQFNVVLSGQQDINFSSVSIINGRRTERVRRGRQFDYRLTPQSSGSLMIPAPQATIDGQKISGNSVEIQVVPPAIQDLVLLDYSVDRTSVYPMQPFTVTLLVSVRELPEGVPDRGQDPLTVQSQPPALSIPWFDDSQLTDDLQPTRGWRQILETHISRRGHGFQINGIGSGSAFSLFENRAAGFHPAPTQVTKKDLEGNDANYFQYEFKREFAALKAGDVALGGITFKGAVANDIQRSRLQASDVYAVAPSITVRVKTVPDDGQPESYIGAVGDFQVQARLNPTNVRVGDPMTLTLTLTGQGTLEDARPPNIDQLAAVADRFRTYEATEETIGNARRFTYSLRPLSGEVTEFPEIPVSWFDVNDEQYITQTTDSIPIEVEEAEALNTADIVTTARNSEAARGPEQRSGGVFANISQIDQVHHEQVRPMRWFTGWAILLIGWISGGRSIDYLRRRAADPSVARRRTAPAMATEYLSQAQNVLTSGDVAKTADNIRQALAGFIAAWADIPEDGLTPRDASLQLTQLRADASLCQQCERILQECDAMRYGTGSDDAVNLIEQTRTCLQLLETAMRTSGGAR